MLQHASNANTHKVTTLAPRQFALYVLESLMAAQDAWTSTIALVVQYHMHLLQIIHVFHVQV